jgi:hypothetical protein
MTWSHLISGLGETVSDRVFPVTVLNIKMRKLKDFPNFLLSLPSQSYAPRMAAGIQAESPALKVTLCHFGFYAYMDSEWRHKKITSKFKNTFLFPVSPFALDINEH